MVVSSNSAEQKSSISGEFLFIYIPWTPLNSSIACHTQDVGFSHYVSHCDLVG